jgi:hypothetical protein
MQVRYDALLQAGAPRWLPVLIMALLVAPAPAAASAPRTRRIRPEGVYRIRVSRPLTRTRRHRAIARRLRSLKARTAIVGGATIEITQAPWQTSVVGIVPINEEEALFLFCGGSLLDTKHVLTAGHCVYDPLNEARIPSSDIFVLAGSSNVSKLEAGEQETKAASVRVHPGYDYAAGAGAADDVAVIEVSEAFTLGPRVEPIGLAAAAPGEGTTAVLTGFGKESPSEGIEGPLHSLGMTVGYSRRCGGEADAVFLCATASAGSGCNGDSGSAFIAGASPREVGVMDTVAIVSGQNCSDGADNGFVNVTAPEIRDFVEGSETPPQAPRGGSGIIVRAVPKVGSTTTCEPGVWSGSPTYTYIFQNAETRQPLQTGSSSTYTIGTGDVGVSIACEVSASNAGGTGVVRTSGLPPVAPISEPPPPPKEQPPSQQITDYAQKAAGAQVEARRIEREREETEAFERARRELEARVRAAQAAKHCVVPSLRGDTLSTAKRALVKAHCQIGKVSRPRHAHGKLVVTRQAQPAGKHEPADSHVAVTLGSPSHHR